MTLSNQRRYALNAQKGAAVSKSRLHKRQVKKNKKSLQLQGKGGEKGKKRRG